MNPLHDHILQCRSLVERGKWVDAQNHLLQVQGTDYRVKTVEEAQVGIMGLYHSLLNAGDWTGAALLRWGKTLFDPDPRSVSVIWKALCNPQINKLLIMGCGSSGKTYSASAWLVLNWSRDPQYTCTKVVSTTYGHNKSGIMSRIGIFHTQSLMKFPGEPVAGGIAFPGLDRSASIMMVAIPEGETGEGRVTGVHPVPRPQTHPIFGALSRTVFTIDEADVVAEGLWSGLDNALGNEDFSESVKVVALTNPRLKQNSFAHRAEPQGGWASLDEDAEEWVSREGWHVISIDAMKSENVQQKKTVFPGLMTYQGYQNYVRKGKSDPDYWTYARGKYPPDSIATFNVFALTYFDNSIGRLMFEGDVTPVASLDPAFAAGGDDPYLTIGRFGRAIGFTNEKGEYEAYKQTKKALQVEQQLLLTKGPTHIMGANIIKILKSYGVRAEWFTMDKTGNALGLYDYIAWQFGKFQGIQWASKATETRILREDTAVADERFKGIAAELWFAAAAWTEHGYVKFSPTMDGFHKLRDELCLRRWKFGTQGLQQLEDKVTFKADNKGKSCDKADAYVMLVHPIRMHSQGLPTTLQDRPKDKLGIWGTDRSIIDEEINWVPDHKLA
jgi:hypothetical protein